VCSPFMYVIIPLPSPLRSTPYSFPPRFYALMETALELNLLAVIDWQALEQHIFSLKDFLTSRYYRRWRQSKQKYHPERIRGGTNATA
jgi:hypothetical protein